ncbi:hypothetical protein K503DRAFT_261731 [Rhizopogon vinicolor AM-OR11-026]|uniref:SWI/SNF and RSC complexes subunit Ssr4 N-terminal domain-containing protein n=1 Tax=Rhizopogon vinicolor AM-OR11-026 TaxID=1314800 RepID=A0A1B7MWJ1_9AGAM|nr:hypothetical protein K503DRAFT_261731 [Rhizopogon vinicolor AM-OR11-026]
MSFQQMQQDAPVLKYPEDFAPHPNISLETAANMLFRAIQTSQNLPYHWTFIDKPQEGQIYLLFMPNPALPLNDGIRWQDQENRFAMPVQRGARELEVAEVKYGFVPNSPDTSAWRVRRRYRLHKGGHPQLVLVHYSRVPAIQIVPSLLNTPVRQYPLRQITDPPVYVIGDKMGQKAFPQAPGPGQGPGPHHQGGMPIPMPPVGMNPQAMIAQQNSNMEALERRRERDRERARDGSASAVGQRPGPPRLDDDESADESELLSTRTLALTRYRRNHELMEEVFKQAAFGTKGSPPPKRIYEAFDKEELEANVVRRKSSTSMLFRAKFYYSLGQATR